jgi:hypothetical protein
MKVNKILRHQVKTKWYYYFWGSMAVAVVGGQIYVGSGYREMAEATKGADISITCEVIPPYTPPVQKVNRTREFE